MPASFAGYARATEGLQVTEENRALQVAALVRELEGYEARAYGLRDESEKQKWEDRADQVREQLRARGETPHQRAAKRPSRSGQETRA